MRLPIFLDTAPGIDDAVAIAAAIFAPLAWLFPVFRWPQNR